MGASLLRSSFSPNIRERRDFSCALFDGEGRMVGQASHLPVHLGSTPLSVRAAIDAFALEPGDAVVLNDPYRGGTHLPDVTFVTPVFLPGSSRPDFYCANRAHHADVGGLHPGSMGAVPDVHGEGLRIPPTRLVRGGELQREVLELMLANMRVPREREGDLFAQWSTNRVGEARLRSMAQEHGKDGLRQAGEALLAWTERLTRDLVRSLPDGRAAFEDVLEDEAVDEDGSPSGRPATLRLALEVRGDQLVCDFRESDAAPRSSRNATRAVTVSAVFYVLRTLLPGYTPTNDGILRPITIHTRPGTLCDARYPSGVAAGNVETSQRLVDVLLGAFARVLPRRLPAASAGTMSNLTFGGDAGAPGRAGEGYAYYETIGGGAGAGPDGPGADALQTHMTNTRNTPIEELELAYPVRVVRYRVRRGSGGRGRHRGGHGLERGLRFLAPARVAFVGERFSSAPWGLAGGAAGAPMRVRLRRGPRGRWRTERGSFTAELSAGSEVLVETPGGGGHGDSGRDGSRARQRARTRRRHA